jgi:hypothetical protein
MRWRGSRVCGGVCPDTACAWFGSVKAGSYFVACFFARRGRVSAGGISASSFALYNMVLILFILYQPAGSSAWLFISSLSVSTSGSPFAFRLRVLPLRFVAWPDAGLLPFLLLAIQLKRRRPFVCTSGRLLLTFLAFVDGKRRYACRACIPFHRTAEEDVW